MDVSETMERTRMSVEGAAESLKRWFLNASIDGEIRPAGQAALRVELSRRYAERDPAGLYKHEFEAASARVREWKRAHPSPFTVGIAMTVKDGEKVAHSFSETIV
jgi:hypothetical protein